MISDLYSFSPNLFNEFSAGWTRDLNYFEGQIDGTSLVRSLGLQGITPIPTPGITTMSIQGLTTVTQQSDSKIPKELYTIRDSVSWTRGKHNMKFGFMAAQGRYYLLPDEPDNVFGNFSFTTALAGGTGNAFANFLLGIPSSESRQLLFNAVYYRRMTYQLFGQDNIEVSRKLTINLGLRYEYYQPFKEIHGQAYTTNLATGALVLPSQSALQLVSPLILQNASFQLQTAAQAGYPSTIYDLSERNFAPRIGFAYRLGEKMVVRSGYGICYYDSIPSCSRPRNRSIHRERKLPAESNREWKSELPISKSVCRQPVAGRNTQRIQFCSPPPHAVHTAVEPDVGAAVRGRDISACLLHRVAYRRTSVQRAGQYPSTGHGAVHSSAPSTDAVRSD